MIIIRSKGKHFGDYMTQRCKYVCVMKNDREKKLPLFDDAYLLLVEFDFPPNTPHVGFVFVITVYFIGYAWYGSVHDD